MNDYFKKLLMRSLTIVLFLLFWETSVWLGLINKIYISCPSDIFKDFIEFYASGELMRHSLITLKEAALGLFFGTLSGIILAFILSYFKFLGQIFEPVIAALNSIPQLTLAPLYILWFGIGLTSKVFMSSIMAFFLIFFATYGGIKNVGKEMEEAAQLLGANDFKIIYKVIFPLCIPWIISGLKGGIGAALVGAIVGEYLGASAGIGWMISFATSYYNIKRVMTCLLLMLIAGSVFLKILDIMEKRALRYQDRTN